MSFERNPAQPPANAEPGPSKVVNGQATAEGTETNILASILESEDEALFEEDADGVDDGAKQIVEPTAGDTPRPTPTTPVQKRPSARTTRPAAPRPPNSNVRAVERWNAAVAKRKAPGERIQQGQVDDLRIRLEARKQEQALQQQVENGTLRPATEHERTLNGQALPAAA